MSTREDYALELGWDGQYKPLQRDSKRVTVTVTTREDESNE